MKNLKLKWTDYLVHAISSMFIILAPLVLSSFLDFSNPNNTAYDTEILTKHFIKIAAGVVFFIGLVNTPFLVLNYLGRKIYLVLFAITFYTAAIIDFAHVLLFKSRINSSSCFSIFSTNQSETLEFISDYSTLKLVSGILIIVLIPLLIHYIYAFFLSLKLKKVMFVIYLACYIVTIFFIIKKSDSFYLNEISAIKGYISYKDFKNEIRNFNAQNIVLANLSANTLNLKEKENYIVVIGESTSKYHMQLYGYNRKTTPELEKMKSKLMVFSHVKSSSVHTIASLTDVLVIKDSDENFTSYSLIDIFKKAGVKTYWLSNQQLLGKNETLISAIANRADKKIFISAQGESKYDEGVLPELCKILKEDEQKKVIFIHLMGTHLSYKDRYPKEFNYFKDKNISIFGKHADSFINHYDNAILYNDYVVSEIINRIDSIAGINSLVYFSDHGDEVFDFRNFHGHSETLLSKYMNSVPFIVYCNKAFKDVKKKKLEEHNKNIETEFSLKNVSHTLQDLFDIKSNYFDESKSFFSPNNQTQYNEKDKVNLLNFKPSPAFPYFDSKIWVHRVNSIERLHLVQDKFKGMELDIVYENGKFDVRHPPAESINLSLEIYFKNVDEVQKHYFWLDLKNLNSINQEEVINRLNYLTNKYQIKNNIIIETTNGELIQGLKNAGYNTSYYLPDLANSNDAENDEKLRTIADNIRLNNPAAISQSLDNYMIMDKYFKNENKLIWALNINWNNSKNHQKIYDMLEKDSTIKVCLINFETDGWK